ncbi:DUF4198 domain-containing protein [Palleronia rufa]|uniref:DUF4198 domain-containing protein n=1 Tax=Palleronia rufa TaxID=1530186 RepID=UPI00056A4E82|nr:DUF4198 domain-containing protein [Palleronia rufa]
MNFLFPTLVVGLAAIGAAPSAAHEFWIESDDYALDPGQDLVATVRVGQKFQGTSYPYFPPNFTLFATVAPGADEMVPVRMRLGDRPALSMPVEQEGLTTVLHVSRYFDLTWESWEKFDDFVREKDGDWVIDAHAERGFEQVEGIREAYARFAKALYAVGDGAGEDRAYGLETEIVALENPYTDAASDGLDVQVLYDGAPRADAQIEVFSKPLGDDQAEATVTKVQTDADGRATVTVENGRQYLLDSVVFREPADDLMAGFDPQWETLWASLTFGLPAD